MKLEGAGETATRLISATSSARSIGFVRCPSEPEATDGPSVGDNAHLPTPFRRYAASAAGNLGMIAALDIAVTQLRLSGEAMRVLSAAFICLMILAPASAFAGGPECSSLFDGSPRGEASTEQAIDLLQSMGLVDSDGHAARVVTVDGRIYYDGVSEDSYGPRWGRHAIPNSEWLSIDFKNDRAQVRFGAFTRYSNGVRAEPYRIVSISKDKLVLVEDVTIYETSTIEIAREIKDGTPVLRVRYRYDRQRKLFSGTITNAQSFDVGFSARVSLF